MINLSFSKHGSELNRGWLFQHISTTGTPAIQLFMKEHLAIIEFEFGLVRTRLHTFLGFPKCVAPNNTWSRR